ncbi:MAG: hypothetical protein N0E44_17980 [Candidatus Thiodiazotropha lotti]|nr:hypothetical protein [Candidatus Thiodiazotropha lotti]MCW4221773.1 hypothetical protein [Candidatus Thiodiazotropha lotti]
MDLNDMTIGQAKELASMFGANQSCRDRHPLHGKKAVAVLPHGFIHFGTLKDQGGRYMLEDASNLRYWKQRDSGLPEFALKGPVESDKIDKIGNVHLETVLFFYPIGDWS